MTRIAFVVFLTIGMAFALPLDFGVGVGVKGGFPFTDLLKLAVPGPTLTEDNNYIVGPVVELRLPFGFALEANGLYRGTSYIVTNPGTLPNVIQSSSWEIPYLAKFRFPIPLLKPFISAGGAYRHFNDLPSGVAATNNGFVGAGGLELRLGRLRLSGEARYLRWSAPPPNTVVRMSQNQGEVLFGVIF